MESLSPESRALYEMLKADTKEEYEAHFLAIRRRSSTPSRSPSSTRASRSKV
jgi:hypothetical protein